MIDLLFTYMVQMSLGVDEIIAYVALLFSKIVRTLALQCVCYFVMFILALLLQNYG